MKYRGSVLILDNLRTELKDYSVDIQDIVRSAILDGIDLSEYIEACKNNPYRLDQIRLSIKQGIEPVFLKVTSGESLYKVRLLKARGVPLSGIASHIDRGALSEDNLNRLISWVESGYKIDSLNISIIPKTLLDVFEQGLQQGFDMSVFNDGKMYKPDYIKSCLVIKANGKNIAPFTYKREYVLNDECMKQLATFSRIRDTAKWDRLIKRLYKGITVEKLNVLISCVKNGIDVSSFDSSWSADCVGIILKAYEKGIDYRVLISLEPDEAVLLSKYNELVLGKSKRVSGRLRKG